MVVGLGAIADGNVASGKTIGGSVTGSTYVNDGDKKVVSNYCSFGSGNQSNNGSEGSYVQIDLGATYRIAQSNIYFYSGDTRYYYYKIKYSTDATNWFYAVGNSSNTGWVPSLSNKDSLTVNPTTDAFAIPLTARYLRIYANGNSVNNGNHIYEWELFTVPQTVIDGGMIKTGSISADRISGGTITGVNIKSINGANRTEINGSDLITYYSNNPAFKLSGNYFYVYNWSNPNVIAGTLTTTSSGASPWAVRLDTWNNAIILGKSGSSGPIQDALYINYGGGVNGYADITASCSSMEILCHGSSGTLPNIFAVSTDYGYLWLGAQNSSYCHFQTDRAQYYFDKPIQFNADYVMQYSSSMGFGYTNEMWSTGGSALYVNWRRGNGLVVGNGAAAYGPIYGSSKNAITGTENYGEVVTYADESPNHVFCDRGCGELDDSGICQIFLDPIFLETVNTKSGDYWVQLTSFIGANAEILELAADYFTVQGTPGKQFMWEVNAERLGYERLRWNEADIYI
jgi:hypothetical protein